MTRHFEAPGVAAARAALTQAVPSLAGVEVDPLGEGWDFATYRAGDKVIRLPKVDQIWTLAGYTPLLQRLQAEAALLAELAPTLPLAVPLPRVYEDGPNGLPFTVYDIVPGVPLRELKRPAAATFGKTYAAFLTAMRAFPMQRLAALGIPVLDGAATRLHRIHLYEELARRTFPLISCEARTYVVARGEAYLNDPRNFDFEPVLAHCDLDHRNVLADPETGELTGVIDFGDAHGGDPAFDFGWMLSGGFDSLGIADQLPAFFAAMGIDPERVRARCEYYDSLWPLYEIVHGLDREDPDEVAEGIRYLNEAVAAAGASCDDASTRRAGW